MHGLSNSGSDTAENSRIIRAAERYEADTEITVDFKTNGESLYDFAGN